ncbi:FAD-dependent oxidoreductase [Pseudomonas sp. N040]|uniref:FAD-dependent oxidoreductase n=1 Tax=Pseudomonas sp. N040 TaxID=2785325 RepID=UPI0018A30DEC|nr:FAD-dependent oxidoreductase [Pseudomonas sp. N040]MBF7729160.1 FAD-dependent oxidoreductase [Pseudomonas sp. N040]MBW7012800.1 FAD-dependent oxidoreductase [Pseudomonas sp. N040]
MKPGFDLLLAGAGHAHLGVLRQWAQGSRPRGRIALLSAGPQAWYSGMLPGLLGGRYAPADCCVALPALCAAAAVELLEGQLVGLDPQAGSVALASGERISATWLSLNLGAQVARLPAAADARLEQLPVKPFADFLAGWSRWQAAPQPLAILGGGAAGVELALALATRVPAVALLSAGPLLAGHPATLRQRALRHLARAGVSVREGVAVESIQGDCLLAGRQPAWRGTRVILATGASAWPWLRACGLACDAQGFVTVAPTLQSLSHPRVFAAGDCASLPGTLRNGVYAVRQGPLLAANLAAALHGRRLHAFVAQRHALALLADGRGGALLSWAGLSAEGRWLGWWKDRLDRAFIRRHSVQH